LNVLDAASFGIAVANSYMAQLTKGGSSNVADCNTGYEPRICLVNYFFTRARNYACEEEGNYSPHEGEIVLFPVEERLEATMQLKRVMRYLRAVMSRSAPGSADEIDLQAACRIIIGAQGRMWKCGRKLKKINQLEQAIPAQQSSI
jgi:hypothetical protein